MQHLRAKTVLNALLGGLLLTTSAAMAQERGSAVSPPGGLSGTSPSSGGLSGTNPSSGGLSGTTQGIRPTERPPVPGVTPIAPSNTGIGSTGTSPGYGALGGAGATTGNTMGGGTGVGIGNTSIGQSTAQSPVGAPTSSSTTPGGPPNANGINMSGAGTNSAAER